ncbi:E3 ubiquitin/ISG15 ligase TRIM25-like isoform X2 [Salarias fasciatus]|uniref:E3 ubiquitin/ISG15 ligase TRIM25-like isoform X2 n=1 Tax=Salarias fasciatus TaxID=181472 RepID=UPI0011769D99|nr:E3 ubiquitin/ISG15 ligase TRIM25-like isoform X2 [Salarias fasciatus]
MASPAVSVEQLCCPVCLEVLREPVTVPCGHSYCLRCIQGFWDSPKQRGRYSCPQCRQLFSPRPALSRNTVLGELVETLQRGRTVPVPPPTRPLPRPQGVGCSVCSPGGSRALKSCLVCLRSYCGPHLRVHEERFRRDPHKLIPASDHLREKLCPEHGKLLRLYCLTHQQCVCSQCAREGHRGHHTVTVDDQRATQQKRLEDSSSESLQRLKEAERELKYMIRLVKHSTEAAIDESERIFSKMIRSIEKEGRELKDLLRAEERLAVREAEDVLDKVQREIAALQRTDAELQKLSATDDHVYFIQKSKSLRFPAKTVEIPNTEELPYVMYKSLRGALTDLKNSLKETFQQEFSRISKKETSLKEGSKPRASENTKEPVNPDTTTQPSISHTAEDLNALYDLEPQTRADLLQYYNNIALDPNTANPYLWLAEGSQAVTTLSEAQPYPDHPDRFGSWAQVLCRAGMAGRCYWEVEWEGRVSICVCYKSMSRKGRGDDSKMGHNAKSWSLDCSDTLCTFHHDRHSVRVPAACWRRIGVFLDFRAGTLSFYNVSDPMLQLHKVQTSFSQPLYPGFWVGLGSSLRLRWMRAPE